MSELRPILLIALLAVCSFATAQDEPMLSPTRTGEFWISTAIETKPFNKKSGRVFEPRFFRKFRSYLETGYRSQENLTGSKLFYVVLGGRYKLNKQIGFGLDYRYNVRDKYTNNSGRIDGQVSYSREIDRWEASYRFNAQHEVIPVVSIRTILRNRFELEYNIKGRPWDPHASAELFTAMHYTGNRLIGVRYEVGMKMDLGNDHDLDLAFRYDREQNIPFPRYRYIMALSYSYFIR